MDYAVTLEIDLPMIDTWAKITPSPDNTLGVQGVGEAGTIAATPVIVNAVIDALSGLGIRHIDMPLRPEKIWAALNRDYGTNDGSDTSGGSADGQEGGAG
jgi:carbon-monoxide dehydrogenase large subunit